MENDIKCRKRVDFFYKMTRERHRKKHQGHELKDRERNTEPCGNHNDDYDDDETRT